MLSNQIKSNSSNNLIQILNLNSIPNAIKSNLNSKFQLYFKRYQIKMGMSEFSAIS